MERMPVKVGVGVLIWKGDKVALVKRSGSYGFGTMVSAKRSCRVW
jgi:hypothetical protein